MSAFQENLGIFCTCRHVESSLSGETFLPVDGINDRPPLESLPVLLVASPDSAVLVAPVRAVLGAARPHSAATPNKDCIPHSAMPMNTAIARFIVSRESLHFRYKLLQEKLGMGGDAGKGGANDLLDYMRVQAVRNAVGEKIVAVRGVGGGGGDSD